MGQAKLRGSFDSRKQAAVIKQAATYAANRQRKIDERMAYDAWRKTHPEEAKRKRRPLELLALLAGMLVTTKR